MGLFDSVTCEYRIPNPVHQNLEFQTKDLERLLDDYTITRDGRLIRRASRRRGLDRDIEWPFHGDLRIYGSDPEKSEGLVEYVVRFTNGRVEWIRPFGEHEGGVADEPSGGTPAPALSPPLTPDVWGRRLTADEFLEHSPEKLELIDGEIPGSEKLLLLLLTGLGLRNAAALVGAERWEKALGKVPATAVDGRPKT